MRHLTVADVMTRNPVRARPAMPLKEIARAMSAHGVSALPVLDEEDRLIGVVSEADLVARQAHPAQTWKSRWLRGTKRHASVETAASVMSRAPITISAGSTLTDAAKVISEHAVKRLLVVDPDGALVGVVSRQDLLKVFLRTDDDIREEIISEVFMRLMWADPERFDVTVREGVVTLDGDFDNETEVALAERLTRRVDGVIDVVNRLTASGPAPSARASEAPAPAPAPTPPAPIPPASTPAPAPSEAPSGPAPQA